jgi:GDP-mannose transporter
MTYTSAKSLQYLSVPIYTIFKNLTIIVIAYGEVLLFKSLVTRMTLLSFGLMVLSSIIAAWADISHAANMTYDRGLKPGLVETGNGSPKARLEILNMGYAWMGLNVLCSAAYVLGMRRVIKNMGFRDWDSRSFLQSWA